MAFAIKGRGSRVPLTYFEKWFFQKPFRIIPWLWKRVLHLVWLDSIAASLFVMNWLSWQIVSDDKIQITILILRRGALPSRTIKHRYSWKVRIEKHCCYRSYITGRLFWRRPSTNLELSFHWFISNQFFALLQMLVISPDIKPRWSNCIRTFAGTAVSSFALLHRCLTET